MKSIIKTFLALTFASMTILSATAQTPSSSGKKTEISVEIDPLTFLSKGYSAHLRLKPKSSEHLLIGLGTYAMDMPKAIVNLNPNNQDKGWNLRLNQGYGLFGEYYFSETNKKFLVGTQVGVQQYKIENEAFTGSEKFTNALLMAYGGYTLQPFEFPLYFKAWAGIGYTSKLSGANKLGEREYDIAPLTAFATLHLGYTF
jgi:hypothetical protein